MFKAIARWLEKPASTPPKRTVTLVTYDARVYPITSIINTVWWRCEWTNQSGIKRNEDFPEKNLAIAKAKEIAGSGCTVTISTKE